eukprot:267716_1
MGNPGTLIPEDTIDPKISSKWRNFFENKVMVQFVHRWMTPLPPPHKLPEPQKRAGSSVCALLGLGEGTQLETARELAKALGLNAVGVSKVVREAANRGSSLKSPESSNKPSLSGLSLSEPGEDSVSIPVKPVRKNLRGLSAKLLEKLIMSSSK